MRARATHTLRVAILAGGRGARFGEATRTDPKPMMTIGNRPLLWHIMMHYASYGFRDFVIALGHGGERIRDHFAGGDKRELDPEIHVELIDTGLDVGTAGRVKRLGPVLGSQTFMLTWGDGLSDVDLDALLRFHRSHGRLATITAVRPPPRFGHLELEGDRVLSFEEKPPDRQSWINGAFFVLEPGVLERISDDSESCERDTLPALAREGELMAYRHHSFWACMDTPRDREELERIWAGGSPPWKTW